MDRDTLISWGKDIVSTLFIVALIVGIGILITGT